MSDKNTELKVTAEDMKRLVDDFIILRKSLKTLRQMKDIQCSDGNWNFSPYMHGMANGMIFALSLFDDKGPEYLEKPDYWLESLYIEKEKSVEVIAT